MRSLKSLSSVVFALLALLCIVSAKPAQAQYPAYLHAISNLRTAREYLKFDSRPDVRQARDYAISEISIAIDEMKKAARDDGKNTSSWVPPQSHGNGAAPLHSAVKLMREARHDAESGQDAPQNAGLQMRSLKHLDNALRSIAPFL
jgi:hypothetical protein